MKSRLVPAAAIALAVVALTVALWSAFGSGGRSPSVSAVLPARPHSYLGVYESESPAGYQMITEFGRIAGREPNLAGYYSGWPELFQVGFARTALAHGAATLVQMDPTGASVAAIAAGDYDPYLRSYADAVRAFGGPVVIGFGHEMNATWYTWGYGHARPATFVAAWRHIVTLFRQQGADNVTWLWTVQADIKGSGPLSLWWPGARYVSWVGIDGYYYWPHDTFATVFGPTIAGVRELTTRPLLLSETSVGPAAGPAAKIPNLFQGMAVSGAVGLVWFDIAQHDGIYHQDWRIEDHPAAEPVFRAAVRKYLASLAGLPR